MYYVSVIVFLLQCLCFTYYWEFSLANRAIVIFPKLKDKDGSCSCQINVTDRALASFSHPIFLEPDLNQIIYPQPGTTIINIPTGQPLMLHCPGVSSILVSDDNGDNTHVGGPILMAKCMFKHTWQFEQLDNFEGDFRNVECKGKLKTWARLGGTTCAENSRDVHTGFRLESGKYIPIMSVCFNYVNKHPLHARTYISKGITIINNIDESYFDDTVRKTFSGEFYRLYTSFSDLYTRSIIRSSINKQVGLGKFSVKYVSTDNLGGYTLISTLLLSHLNYLYPFEKRATYYYVNTFPMWKKNITTSWEKIELLFRKYTAYKKRNLEVFAGTHGFMHLPHNKTNECKPMYLHYAVQAGLIPIPAIVWRAAIDAKRDAGVAIMIVNNPFNVCVEDAVCPDISDTLPWMEEIKNDMSPMKVYACDIREFRATLGKRLDINDVPNILNLTFADYLVPPSS